MVSMLDFDSRDEDSTSSVPTKTTKERKSAMIKEPKYRYYYSRNKVIAVSSYAGKRVQGVAKCAPEDAFDLDYGKRLAQARCALKIAHKRLKRADEKANAASKMASDALVYEAQMGDYQRDAYNKSVEAAKTLVEIIKERL